MEVGVRGWREHLAAPGMQSEAPGMWREVGAHSRTGCRSWESLCKKPGLQTWGRKLS